MATGDHLTGLLAAAEEEFAETGFRTGDFARARELLAEALAGAERADDLAGRARALDLLGMVAHYDNIAKLMSGHRVPDQEIDAEERLFRQALAAWHAAGQRPAAAQALFGLGLVDQVLHRDWASAMPFFWQAFELADVNDVGVDLYLRSEVHRHVGLYFLVADEQPAEAVRHLRLLLDLREQPGDPRRIPPGRSRWRRPSWQPATASRRSNCCAPPSCRPGKPGYWLSGSRTPNAPCGRRKLPPDTGTEDRNVNGRSDSSAADLTVSPPRQALAAIDGRLSRRSRGLGLRTAGIDPDGCLRRPGRCWNPSSGCGYDDMAITG